MSNITTALTKRLRAYLVLSSTILFTMWHPGIAHSQQTRIALWEVSGSGGGRVERAVVEILAENFDVIGPRDYKKAARELDAGRKRAGDIAKVAATLGAAQVIYGEVDKSGGKRDIVLSVRSGSTGQETAEVRVPIKRRRLSRREVANLRQQLLAATSSAGPAVARPDTTPDTTTDTASPSSSPPEPAPPAPDPEPTPQADPEPDIVFEDDVTADSSSSGDGAGDSDDGGDEVMEFDEGIAVAPVDQVRDTEDAIGTARRHNRRARQAAEAAPMPPLQVWAGLDFMYRSLDSTVLNAGTEAPSYSGSGPGIALDLEVFPTAFVDSLPGILSRFGLRGGFELHFIPASEFTFQEGGSNMNADLGITSMRFSGGLLFRQPFGRGPAAPMLKVGVNYDSRSFTLDRDAVSVRVPIPDVTYASIEPNVALRLGIIPALAATVSGSVYLITGVGDLENADQYGEISSSLGLRAGLALDYEIIPRVLVRASFDFMRVGLELESDVQQASGVEGFTDLYLTSMLTAGYTL